MTEAVHGQGSCNFVMNCLHFTLDVLLKHQHATTTSLWSTPTFLSVYQDETAVYCWFTMVVLHDNQPLTNGT
jgi:hypothetical protein